MKVVSGTTQDGSRTAFLFAEDLERGDDRPRLLIAGAWCSLVVGIGWFALITATALFADLEDIGPELLVLNVVPLFGIVMAGRLLRNNDDIAAMICLVPLHLFGTLPMLGMTVISVGSVIGFMALAAVTVLTAAPPVLFWLDARAWARSSPSSFGYSGHHSGLPDSTTLGASPSRSVRIVGIDVMRSGSAASITWKGLPFSARVTT